MLPCLNLDPHQEPHFSLCWGLCFLYHSWYQQVIGVDAPQEGCSPDHPDKKVPVCASRIEMLCEDLKEGRGRPYVVMERNTGLFCPPLNTEIPFPGHSKSQRLQTFYQKLGLGNRRNKQEANLSDFNLRRKSLLLT